ncbi:hypothetical protein ACM66B_007036 [Microbotryomycetes sp. NB124-2]
MSSTKDGTEHGQSIAGSLRAGAREAVGGRAENRALLSPLSDEIIVVPTLPNETIAMIVDCCFDEFNLFTPERKDLVRRLESTGPVLARLVKQYKFEAVNLFAASLEELEYFYHEIMPDNAIHVKHLHLAEHVYDLLCHELLEMFATNHET